MKRVLVLGSSGFMGQNLTTMLIDSGVEVVGYDRVDSNIATINIVGDWTREQYFDSIIKDYDIGCIYHLISTTTPSVGTERLMEEINNNIVPTIALLDTAVKCGVERVIFTSSGGTVYGEGVEGSTQSEEQSLRPICSYGIQKVTIESILELYSRTYGIKTITARISNPYGVCLQNGRTQGVIPILISRLLKGEPITLYGDTTRDYLYIDDVIRALVMMKDYMGEDGVFNIGAGTGTKLGDIVKLVEKVSNKRFASISYEDIRICDVEYSVLDCTRAEKELGWTHTISIKDGIEKTYSIMKEKLEQ